MELGKKREERESESPVWRESLFLSVCVSGQEGGRAVFPISHALIPSLAEEVSSPYSFDNFSFFFIIPHLCVRLEEQRREWLLSPCPLPPPSGMSYAKDSGYGRRRKVRVVVLI